MRKLFDFNPAGNARFFQRFSSKSFVKLSVGFYVTLEQVVFDGALVEFVGFLLLLFLRAS